MPSTSCDLPLSRLAFRSSTLILDTRPSVLPGQRVADDRRARKPLDTRLLTHQLVELL
jgi:hypothetical protein